jgi:F0F1-type ATP synthase membrane subunit c/vacuolar-type H+-ATPase subunit K
VNFLRLLWRVSRQVFHEVTGTLFLLFAFVDGAAGWREWRQGNARWAAALAVGFALLLTAFGVRSFRDARRLG